MTKHIADATGSWKTRTGLLLALLVALVGTVFAVRDQAEASFIVGTASLSCTQNPSSGTISVGAPVVLTCTIAVSNATDGAAFPSATINVDDDINITSTVGTGEFAGCADIVDVVVCAAAANLNAGSETITISGTVAASALAPGNPQPAICVQGNGFLSDDAGAGAVNIPETSGGSPTQCVTVQGATTAANATNVIGVPHTFVFTLPAGFTCESDANFADGLRSCTSADVTVVNAGGATANTSVTPTVSNTTLSGSSTVSVTVLSNTPGTVTVTLLVKFQEDDVAFIDTPNLTAVKTYQSVADFLGDSVIRHYDVDAGSESAADGDGTGDGLLIGNDGDVTLGPGVFAPNTDTNADQIEDDDDAIGSLHTACIVTGPLTHTAHAGFITWNIEDTELDPSVDVAQELSGDALVIPLTPLKADAPCFQWASAAVGDQTIEAVFDPDGIVGPIEGVPIRFDRITEPEPGIFVPGTQPLVKEWNSIDSTIIVSVSGVVGGDTTPDGDETLGGNTDELKNWDTGESATACERDRNSVTVLARWCGSRTNQDGATLTVTGTLTAGGLVNPSTNRSFIEYTLGSHTTHFNGPIDGAEQLFRFSGCGSVLLENPETGDVIHLGPGQATVLSSNYGIGFTFLARDTSGDLDCRPGDEASVTISTSQDIVLTSAEDTAPTEVVRVNFFAQQIAKQPILAWAGQRIQLAHNWFGGEGCLGDVVRGDSVQAQQELNVGVYARYEIERGDGAFVPFEFLGNPEGDDVFHASLGTVLEGANPCTSYVIYEQEKQGQVDIKATLELCVFDDFIGSIPQVSDESCFASGFVYNFLVYYMEFEDITLGAVGGAREHHNGGLFHPTGNINDASTDTTSATANVSADVLLRARVRGWFKTSDLDTEGTNRPAEGGKPSGRYVMPDDWLLLAGGVGGDDASREASALLFRPNYDTMLTAGGAVSCGSNISCSSSPAFGVPVSTANPAVTNSPVVGPFSLLDPGPNVGGIANSAEFGGRETFLPDGQINKWDAPVPPALVTFSYVGETVPATATSSGFLKEALKFLDVYQGQNPYYLQAIPESPIIGTFNNQNYLWNTWQGDGYYEFWLSVLTNRFPNSLATSPYATSTELAQIQGQHSERIGRILNVYSDNHGEAMIFANGDFRLTYDECDTNVIGGGKHCAQDDKVGTSNVYAVADYPDFKKKPQIASTPVAITWTWGGYKEVTIEPGETDQFKYVVFHAIDRDKFCSLPLIQATAYDLGGNSQFRGTAVAGGVNDRALKPVYEVTAGGALTFVNTAIPHLVTLSHSLHPVLSSLDATNTIGANDPVESVDFTIDAGEGIVVATSDGPSHIDLTKRFVTGVPTYSTLLNTTIKEFPTLHGTTDECQAWIRVSNSLLGILDVLVLAHDDEGDIGVDAIVDFQGTISYTLNFRWSLITYAGPTVPVSDALKGTGANDAGNDIFDQVTAVYGWDQVAQQWLGFFPDGVNVPGANDLTQLETGKAYWIAIKGPGPVTWTVATNVGG